MKKNIFLLSILLVSVAAVAEDWTVSFSVSQRDQKFSLPNNKYDNEGWSTSASLMKQVNPDWLVGGTVTYSDSRSNVAPPLDNDINYRTTAVSGFAIRSLGTGLFADFSLGYGGSTVDSSRTVAPFVVTYDSSSDFVSASAGLTQYIPASENLMFSLSGRYTYLDSRVGGHADNYAVTTERLDDRWGFVSLGAGVSYTLDKFRPYARVDWHKASQDFVAGTGDDNYFSYRLGLNYAATDKASFGFSYGSTASKAYSHENNFGVSASYQF